MAFDPSAPASNQDTRDQRGLKEAYAEGQLAEYRRNGSRGPAPRYVPPYSDQWTVTTEEGRELLRSVGLSPTTRKACE